MANAFSTFFWNDWQVEATLRVSSLAAQGLWMRMLCVMAESTPFGYMLIAGRPCEPEDLAKLVGESPDVVRWLIGELEKNGVFSRNRKGVIYCRRMVREEKKRAASSKGGKKGGAVSASRKTGIHATRGGTRKATRETTRHPVPVPVPVPTPVPSSSAETPPETPKPEPAARPPTDPPDGRLDLLGKAQRVLEVGNALPLLQRVWGSASHQARAVDDISAILAMGADFERDVLPTVKRMAERKDYDGDKIISLRYFADAIREGMSRKPDGDAAKPGWKAPGWMDRYENETPIQPRKSA